MGQKKEESSRPFWKELVSRERLFLFSAVVRDTRAVSSQPRVQRAFGHTRPFYDSRPQTWNGFKPQGTLSPHPPPH